jgi:lipoprotein-anchoring transpeptidase ErfK/SrfK
LAALLAWQSDSPRLKKSGGNEARIGHRVSIWDKKDFSMNIRTFFILAAAVLSLGLAGCTTQGGMLASDYAAVTDAGYQLPAISLQHLPNQYRRQIVDYETREKPGTIVVDTGAKFLYLVMEDGKAMRYGIGVGREGFEWKGRNRVSRKAEWPGWTPPPAMIRRERAKGNILPAHMEGGPANPLGARALYIGSTIYRIHGTPEVHSIGQAMSSGCIRLINQDIIDLYNRVEVGARVVVM